LRKSVSLAGLDGVKYADVFCVCPAVVSILGQLSALRNKSSRFSHSSLVKESTFKKYIGKTKALRFFIVSNGTAIILHFLIIFETLQDVIWATG
jgi:hypothetical protein